MRIVAALLLLTGCTAIFDLEKPQLVDALGNIDTDDAAIVDAAIDAPPDVPPLAECPTSYTISIGTSRYRRLAGTTEWLTAAATCAGDKLVGSTKYTHLVVLANTNEGLSLAQMLGFGSMWLGLSDRRMEGTYRWVTAEPINGYPPANGSPWANGEPDNALGQDCVVSQNGQLADTQCSASSSAVCECDDYPDDPSRY
jgi:hypothetical protein